MSSNIMVNALKVQKLIDKLYWQIRNEVISDDQK